MTSELYNILKNRGIIHTDSLVTGKVISPGLGQVPQLVHKRALVRQLYNNYLICQDEAGRRYRMEYKNIYEIDGMTPTRLASVYNIRSNGTAGPVARKRGRKPKSLVNTMEVSHGKNQRAENHNQAQ